MAFRLVELLEAAVEVREEDEFRLYKEFEPEKIQQALDHVSWGAALPRVAGELMSNLILRHSLPNANHRTGIALLQFCIESVDPSFEMPRTHVDDDTWRDALSEHAGRHETHCTEFARAVLERAERDDLLDQPGPTRQEFVEYLETGVDRDFRELF